MSAFPIWHIQCDVGAPGCWGGRQGEPEIGDPGQTATAFRAVLAAAGWTHSHGRDVCPDCRARAAR